MQVDENFAANVTPNENTMLSAAKKVGMDKRGEMREAGGCRGAMPAARALVQMRHGASAMCLIERCTPSGSERVTPPRTDDIGRKSP